ncbi:high-affinity zinc uptake system membrane protein ZnuB [Candidatus Photodesmus katoptron Akat1]|uniref:High-affinity zinc uptake system membrane protein ZnuB n=2 Tax=Candidatus Photodesmus anomalopis TaxID=28176 RepID=S3DIA2_9GAMM|nr:high-affinity zinc uptake system membrane protein ZnuB [Candidatus Photodesmus katoptron Akat1]
MAYFGEALAHASLMGISLGFLLNINIYFSLIICSLLLSFILVLLQKQRLISTDTLLGILAHSFLSLGLVTVSFLDDIRVDIMDYLFGDILSVSPMDLLAIYTMVSLASVVLILFWRSLLSVTINEDLASVEGLNVDIIRILLMLILGLVIAVGMRSIGVLTITSLLIIPPAIVRPFSKTPEQMAIFASFVSIISVLLGLVLSWFVDTPSGPSIVISATAMFILSQTITFVRSST